MKRKMKDAATRFDNQGADISRRMFCFIKSSLSVTVIVEEGWFFWQLMIMIKNGLKSVGSHLFLYSFAEDSMEHEQNDLEDQYEQSMQHRLDGGRRGHIGLGFHEDNPEDAKKRGEESGENAAVGSIMETCDVGDDGFTKDDRHKRKSTEEPNRSDDPDVKKIRFVKASS